MPHASSSRQDSGVGLGGADRKSKGSIPERKDAYYSEHCA